MAKVDGLLHFILHNTMNNEFYKLKLAAWDYRKNPCSETKARFDQVSTLDHVERLIEMIEAEEWIDINERLPSTELLPNGDTPVVLVQWKPETRASNIPNIDVSNTMYLTINASKALYWKHIIPPKM